MKLDEDEFILLDVLELCEREEGGNVPIPVAIKKFLWLMEMRSNKTTVKYVMSIVQSALKKDIIIRIGDDLFLQDDHEYSCHSLMGA